MFAPHMNNAWRRREHQNDIHAKSCQVMQHHAVQCETPISTVCSMWQLRLLPQSAACSIFFSPSSPHEHLRRAVLAARSPCHSSREDPSFWTGTSPVVPNRHTSHAAASSDQRSLLGVCHSPVSGPRCVAGFGRQQLLQRAQSGTMRQQQFQSAQSGTTQRKLYAQDSFWRGPFELFCLFLNQQTSIPTGNQSHHL